MSRWSIPRSPVPLDEDEIELGRMVAQYLDDAYRMFFNAAPDWELERHVPMKGWPIDAFSRLPRGIPRQDVDVSLEAMERVRASLDDMCEQYGTSGELEVRGFWMPIDVESDQGLAGETKS